MLLDVWRKAVYVVRCLGEGGVCCYGFGRRRCMLLDVWGGRCMLLDVWRKAVYVVSGLEEGGVCC